MFRLPDLYSVRVHGKIAGKDPEDFRRQFNIARGKLPVKEVLDYFDEDSYDLSVRRQARLAYNTACTSRHVQLRLVKEQEQLLRRARSLADDVQSLDQVIRQNEQLVIELRDIKVSPSYSLAGPSPPEAVKFDFKFACQTPFRTVPSKTEITPPTQSNVASSSTAVPNLPPIDNTGWETDTEASMSTAYECSCEDSYVAQDDVSSTADTEVGFDDIEHETTMGNSRLISRRNRSPSPIPNHR